MISFHGKNQIFRGSFFVQIQVLFPLTIIHDDSDVVFYCPLIFIGKSACILTSKVSFPDLG